MATSPDTTGAPTRAPETTVNTAPYRINGCTIGEDDPDQYLDQAHGVLAFINVSICEAGGLDELPANDKITASALEGVSTLIQLAGRALALERANSRTLRKAQA